MAKHAGPVKIDKASVEYRQAEQRNNGGRRCGSCAQFCDPHACLIIVGLIERSHVCNRWEGRNS